MFTRLLDIVTKSFNTAMDRITDSIESSDISILHRISRPQSTSNSSRPRPVVVKFTRKSMRNDVLHHRKELKGKNISITEQLTSPRSSALKKANDLVISGKLSAAWSQDGRILIKAHDNLMRQIASISDLAQYSG